MTRLKIDEVVEIPEMAAFHDERIRVTNDTLAFHAPESTFYIDLPTRTISVDAPVLLPPPPAPMFGGRAMQTFLHDGRAGVILAGDRHILWSKPAKFAQLRTIDDELFGLQINDQHLLAVEQGDEPRVRWSGLFPPYIYDIARLKNGDVLVATAGRGGYVYEVDSDGEVKRKTNVPGGASALIADRGKSGRVVASGWECVLVIDGKNDVREIVKLKGAFRAVWFRGKRLACLCGDPTPGVVFARLP